LFLFNHVVEKRSFPAIEHENMWSSLGEGFRFIWKTKIVLWAISLDLVSVLFGGVVALLPIFAEDILKVGPEGLGYLRAAPSIGALYHDCFNPISTNTSCMAQYATGCSWFRHIYHYFCFFKSHVAVTLCFSHDRRLRQYFCSGASNHSTNFPPENMRGRVAAVNGMFVSSSNELGAFESGLAAKYMGTLAATLFGGCMTLAVVILSWTKTKDLFHVDINKGTDP
jgi:hypothetical protein